MINRSKTAQRNVRRTRISKFHNAARASIERMETRLLFSGAALDQSLTPAHTLFVGPVSHENNVDLLATPASQIGNLVTRVMTSSTNYGGGGTISVSTAVVGHVAPGSSTGGSVSVRLSDGTLSQNINDLQSNGFGTSWGVTRSWTNNPGYPDNGKIGNNWTISQEPQLYLSNQTLGGPALVITDGSDAQWFTSNGNTTNPIYAAESWLHSSLTYTGGDFVMTDAKGDQTTFFGVSGVPASQQGAFKSYQPAGGQMISAAYDSSGNLLSESRTEIVSGILTTESYLYSYYGSGGPNAGEISKITEELSTASGTAVLRQAVYDYYDGSYSVPNGQAYGNLNDLRSVTIENGQGSTLSEDYYRYYVPGNLSGGYSGGLKYEVTGVDFSQLSTSLPSGITPFTASDNQVSSYADLYLEYGQTITVPGNASLATASYSYDQVTKEVVAGATTDANGTASQGTYLFDYGTPNISSAGYNNWYYQTTETLPDSSQQIVYSNIAGEAMLTVNNATSASPSITYNQYNGFGQIVLSAEPAAVLGFNPLWGRLVDDGSGQYQYLAQHKGLIDITQYYGESSAFGVSYGYSSSSNHPTGFVEDVQVQMGIAGSPVALEQTDYQPHTALGATIYLVGDEDDPTEYTDYAYPNWYSNSFQPQQKITTTSIFGDEADITLPVTTSTFDVDGNEITRQVGDDTPVTQSYDVTTGLPSDPSAFNILPEATYDAPTGINETYNLVQNKTLAVSAALGVLATDINPDPEKPVCALLLAEPMHGSLTMSDTGSYSYVPNNGFTGADSFQYVVADGTQHSEATTVTLNVVSPTAILATGQNVAAVRGVASQYEVASFVDGSNGSGPYTAWVTFGTNPAVAGTVSASGNSWIVTAPYSFPESGQQAVSVSIASSTNGTAITTSAAMISNPPIVMTGGLTLQSHNYEIYGVLATFVDSAGFQPLSHYAATITYGDGTSGAGAISYNASTNTFAVSADHNYASDSQTPYALNVKLYVDGATSSPISVTSTAVVSDNYILNADAGDNSFYLRLYNDTVQIFQNTSNLDVPTWTMPREDLGEVIVNGGLGQDVVTVDCSGGNPLPHGMMFYGGSNATGNGNELVVTGTGGVSLVLSPSLLSITNSYFGLSINYSGVQTFNLFGGGVPGSLVVTGGSYVFSSDLGEGGSFVNVTVDSGASVGFGVTQHLNALTIDSGGSVQMLVAVGSPGAAAGGQVLDTNLLSVSGTLDLANNDLIVNTPGSNLDSLEEAVAAGVTASATQGIIFSSTAATDGMTIGVAPATALQQLDGPTNLDGQNVPSTALVARYTAYGDANLDGVVDISDFNAMNSNYGHQLGTSPPQWYSGDFNYDGRVDIQDFTSLDAGFNTTFVASPTNVELGQAYSLTLPISENSVSVLRWDVDWGDGTVDSFSPSIASVSHAYTATGSPLIQMAALLSTGAVYHAAATSLVITAATGLTALNLYASSATDNFNFTDENGSAVIAENGVEIQTIPVTDLLSVNITGDTYGTLTVDFSGGDPLPPSGLYSDSKTIDIAGDSGADTLITSSTVIDFGNPAINSAEIRHPVGTAITFLNAGAGDQIVAISGTVTVQGDGSNVGPTVLVNSNASVLFTGTLHLSALDILPGGTARLIDAGTSVLVTNSLLVSAAEGSYPEGVLDLNDNDLIVHGGSLSDITALLSSGYRSGAWDGVGIVSSVAASDPSHVETLGVGQVQTGTFDNQSVAFSDVEVKFTYVGDTNLDGLVDASDIVPATSGQAASWSTGDFNYDGVATGADLSLLAAAAGTLGNTKYSVGGPLSIPAGAAPLSYLNLPTVTPNGIPIARWLVDWGNGAAPVTFVTNDPTHTPAAPYDMMGTYVADFIAMDWNDNKLYRYPHFNVTVLSGTGSGTGAATLLTATATISGPVNLRWVPSGTSTTSFEILREDSGSTTFNMIATVPWSTSLYEDASSLPDTQYNYEVAAVAGTTVLNTSTVVAISTAPLGVTYQYVETDTLSFNSAHTQPTVTSQITLIAGQHYEFIATGRVILGQAGGGPEQLVGDAEYNHITTEPDLIGYGGVNYGIGIDDPTNSANKYAYWGQPATDPNNTYIISYTPTTTHSVTFTYHDDNFVDDENYPGSTLQVQILKAVGGLSVTTSSTPLQYAGGADALPLDDAILVRDGETTQISGATVTLSNDPNGSYVLALPVDTTSSIVGTWNSSTATLTLSGTASVTAYQAALRTVTFGGIGQIASLIATFTVTDNDSLTGSATRSINVQQLIVTPIPITAVVGEAIPVQNIATVTGGPDGSYADQYHAKIDWGDGTDPSDYSTDGVITQDENNPDEFIVSTPSSPRHIYATGGDKIVQITVSYSDYSGLSLSGISSPETIDVNPDNGLSVPHLTAVADANNGSIDLSWTDLDTNIDHYVLERYTLDPETLAPLIGSYFSTTFGTATTFYADSAIEIGTTYSYDVYAIVDSVHSPLSNQASAKVVPDSLSITSTAGDLYTLPSQSHSAIGYVAVTPTSDPGQNVTNSVVFQQIQTQVIRQVSVGVPDATGRQKVDIFLLLDDTGSMQQAGPLLALQLPSIITELRKEYPSVDFGVGVGRMGEYDAQDDGDSVSSGESPFILDQPVLTLGATDFTDPIKAETDPSPVERAIIDALNRAPINPNASTSDVSAIEALYQLATGVGLDSNGDGSTTTYGVAGSGMIEGASDPSGPGDSRGAGLDVPAFSSFQSTPLTYAAPATANVFVGQDFDQIVASTPDQGLTPSTFGFSVTFGDQSQAIFSNGGSPDELGGSIHLTDLNGTIYVYLSHPAIDTAGTYPVRVQIDPPTGAPVDVVSNIVVAPLSQAQVDEGGNPRTPDLSVISPIVNGSSFDGVVASFSGSYVLSNFTATISWGDGTAPQIVTAADGDIVDEANGYFVRASHQFTETLPASANATMMVTLTSVSNGWINAASVPITTNTPSSAELPPSGTLGGGGFRVGALPIILVATDSPLEAKFSDTDTDTGDSSAETTTLLGESVVGKPSNSAPVTVPMSDFMAGLNYYDSGDPDAMGDAPLTHLTTVILAGTTDFEMQSDLPLDPGVDGPEQIYNIAKAATIQDTVNALNALGAKVIGLGGNGAFDGLPGANPDTPTPENQDPRSFLTALARLTGADNSTSSTLVNGTNEGITSGGALYFQITPNDIGTIAGGIQSAIGASLGSHEYDVSVVGSGPSVSVTNLSSNLDNVAEGANANFNLSFGSNSNPASSDILFVDQSTGQLFASLPVRVSSPYKYAIQASDAQGLQVSFRIVGAISPAGVDGDLQAQIIGNTFVWTPLSPGVYTFTIQASAGNLTQNQTFTVTATQAASNNADPQISSIANQTAVVGQNLVFNISASDSNGDPLRYYLFDAPAGMTIDTQNGAVTWNAERQQVGTYPITAVVIDNHGGRGLSTFNVVAQTTDTTQYPPVITSSAPADAPAGDLFTYHIQAIDPSGNAFSFELAQNSDGTAQTLPSGMQINLTTGDVVWTPSLAQVGVYTIDFNAIATVGGSTPFSETFTVVARPATPTGFVVGDDERTNSAQDWYASWLPNSEANIIGYNIYEAGLNQDYGYAGNFTKLNSALLVGTEAYLFDFKMSYDLQYYGFEITAVNSSGIESTPSSIVTWYDRRPIVTSVTAIQSDPTHVTLSAINDVSDSLPLEWSVVSCPAGINPSQVIFSVTNSSNGSTVAAVPEAGSYVFQVIAIGASSDSNPATTAEISIAAQPTTISVQPVSITVSATESVNVGALSREQILDQFGNPIDSSASFTWSMARNQSGGTIQPDGEYVAGSTEKPDIVQVSSGSAVGYLWIFVGTDSQDDIAAIGSSLTGTEGIPNQGQILATFVTASPITTDISASVDWGDGSTTDSSSTVFLNNGVYEVLAGNAHVFESDSYNGGDTLQKRLFSVAISASGYNSDTVEGAAAIDDAPITVQPFPTQISLQADNTARVQLANVVDSNSVENATNLIGFYRWTTFTTVGNATVSTYSSWYPASDQINTSDTGTTFIFYADSLKWIDPISGLTIGSGNHTIQFMLRTDDLGSNADGSNSGSSNASSGHFIQTVSDAVTVSSSGYPAGAPENLIATGLSANAVVLTWNYDPSVFGYVIARISGSQTWSDPTWLTVGGGYTTSNPFTDTSVQPSTTYEYELFSTDEQGNVSLPAFSTSVTTFPTYLPANVTNLSAVGTIASDTSTSKPALGVQLYWDPQPTDLNVVGYDVQRLGSAGWTSVLPTGKTVDPNGELFEGQLGYFDSTATFSGTTSYQYRVVTISNVNDSDGHAEVSSGTSVTAVLDEAPPSIPTGVLATSYPQGIQITWNDRPESDDDNWGGWNVYRKEDGQWIQLNQTLITDELGYDDLHAPSGTVPIQYGVCAVSAEGYPSILVEVDKIRSIDAEPAIPTSFTALPSGPNAIQLNWSAVVAAQNDPHTQDATAAYRIYWSTTAGFTPDYANGSNLLTTISAMGGNPPGTSYSYTPNSASTTYYYAIVAVDGDGDYSNPAFASKKSGGGQTLAAPVVTASNIDLASATLSWSSVSAAVGYEVFRRKSTDTGPFQLVSGSSLLTTLSFQDDQLEPASTYDYQVYAFDAQGDASNPAGLVSVTTSSAIDNPNLVFPTVIIDSPSSSGTDPLVVSADLPVEGIVSDLDNDLDSWKLVLRPYAASDASRDIIVSQGSTQEGELPGTSSLLGAIRPSTVANGLYNLILLAVDKEGNQATPSELSYPIQIQSQMKLGNLTLPFTDLTINVPGGDPITVTRSYDSSQANVATNVGYGWQLNISGSKISDTATAEPGLGDPAFRDGDLVYLTLPSGQQYTFEFYARPSVNDPDEDYIASADTYTPQFLCVDGSGSKLSLAGESDVVLYQNSDGGFTEEGGNNYNPASDPSNDYILTTADGTRYGVNPATGAVDSATNSNGVNVMGTPPTVTTVHGQVQSISVNGQTVQYGYDPDTGDLTTVTDATNHVTHYTYNADHQLISIVDANGVTVLSATYDPSSGLLTSLVNTDNESSPVHTGDFNGNTGDQVVTDAAGNQTEDIYDAYGNVIRKIQTITDNGVVTGYLVTVSSYGYFNSQNADADFAEAGVSLLNDVTGETSYAPFEITGTDSAGTRYTQQPTTPPQQIVNYNNWNGDPTSLNDIDLGQINNEMTLIGPAATSGDWLYNVTQFSNYNTSGGSIIKPLKTQQFIATTNASGGVLSETLVSSTNTTYDTAGNLTSSNAGTGVVTSYDYSGGQLIDTYQQSAGDTIKVLISSSTYDSANDSSTGAVAGMLESSTTYNYEIQNGSAVALSQTTYYVYDQQGNVLLSYTSKNIGSSASANWVWTASFTTYDKSGRSVETSEATYANSVEVDGPLDVSVTWSTDPASTTTASLTVNESLYNGVAVLPTGNTTYTADGQTQTTTDQYGDLTTDTYDTSGHLILTQYADGTQVRSAYDSLGRVVWQSDRFVPANSNLSSGANVSLVTYTLYNSLGQAYRTERYNDVAILIVPDFSTDAAGMFMAVAPGGLTPASLNFISYTQSWYDDQGRVIETLDPSGLRTGTIYDSNGQGQYSGILSSNAPDGGRTVINDGIATISFSTTDFDSYTKSVGNLKDTSTGYLWSGLFYSQTVDAKQNSTYTYSDSIADSTDQIGSVSFTVFSDGSFTQNISSIGDAVITLDPLVNHELPAGLVTPAGLVIPAGGHETIEIAQRKIADAVLATFNVYDAAGNLIDVYEPSVLDGDPNSPTHGQTITPHWHYDYDASGNQISQTQVNASSSTDANTRTTIFTYDANGNRLSHTLPDGEEEYFTYDQYGRLLTHTDFDGHVTVEVYDDNASLPTADQTHLGRLVEELRFSSVSDYQTAPGSPAESTHTTYDALGRASVVDEYAGSSSTPVRETTTTYEPITGQVASITSPEGTINYAYDPATGQHIRTWTANNDTVYTYDAQGRLSNVYTLLINGQRYATYASWNENTHQPVYSSGTPLDTAYTYDLNGNLLTDSQPDGYTTTYNYDALNRLTLETVKDGTALVETFDYNSAALPLRSDGLRQGVVDTRYESDGTTIYSQTTTAWRYDNLGRLTDETLTVQTSATDTPVAYHDHFIFDLANNRVEEDTTGGDTGTGVITYIYNSDDQLLHETRTGSNAYQIDYGHYVGATFVKGYDANGSRLEEHRTGTNTEDDTYTWDIRGRMTSATESGVTTTYTYDSDGVRVSETTGTDVTTYLNDPNNPTGYTKAVEENSTSTGLRSYILGLKVEGQRDAAHGTLLMITDGHGSTRELVDLSSGTIVQHYDYDAYGTVLGNTSLHATYWTSWLFAGDGQWDPSTGWTYQLARWRDGAVFTSMDSFSGDPGSPMTLNKYLYAGGNPISNWDPSGHASVGEILTVVGIGLNVLNFGYHFSSGISHFAHGQTNAGNVDMAWAAIDLFTLGLPFAGPGAGLASAGVDAIPTVLSLSRVGVNIASIWGYLTTLFSASSGSGGGGSGSSGGGSSSSSSGSWGQPPDNGAPPSATEYQQRIAQQFGDAPPQPGMEYSLGGRWFDGVNQAAKKLIEAKGPGYDALFKNLVDDYGITAPLDKLRKQLLEQSVIAKSYGYTLEVHVAEQSAAQRIQSVAPSGVTVVNTP